MFAEFIVGLNKELANELPMDKLDTQLWSKSRATQWEVKGNSYQNPGCLAYKQTNELCVKNLHMLLADTLILKLRM